MKQALSTLSTMLLMIFCAAFLPTSVIIAADVEKETEVYDLLTPIPHSYFEGLANTFRPNFFAETEACSSGNRCVAGFLIAPIIEEEAIDENTIEFHTRGLRVGLALFVDNGGQAPQIEIHTFTDMRSFFDPTFTPDATHNIFEIYFEATPSPFSTSFVVSPPTPGENAIGTEDSRVKDSEQEFELVFLDISLYKYLAMDASYYPNQTRPSLGIAIERALTTVEDRLKPAVPAIKKFRTLVFRPDPFPVPGAMPDEAALAYSYGEHCPPYWRYRAGLSKAELLALNAGHIVTEHIARRERITEELSARELFSRYWYLVILALAIGVLVTLAAKGGFRRG